MVEISTSSEPKLKRKSELGPYREKTFVMNGSPMVEPAKDTELSTTYPGQGTQPGLSCELRTTHRGGMNET